MNGELFPAKAVRQLSPRLRWCEKHGVVTQRKYPSMPEIQWRAWNPSKPKNWIGVGPTEEEACQDLGVKLGIKLWNEVEP